MTTASGGTCTHSPIPRDGITSSLYQHRTLHQAYIIVKALLHIVVVEVVSLDQCDDTIFDWAVFHCLVRVLELWPMDQLHAGRQPLISMTPG